ncbi:MAG: hypothetical protein JWM80_1861 [Cyanobacteria bacterium RYN_339]|nr:hypothetical protein [Cyanobacteria bacterium RYN_339]
MRRRWIGNVGLGLVLAACGRTPSVDASAAPEPLPARVLESGAMSALDTNPGATHEYVVDDADQWQRLYASHKPDGVAPAVDFAHERVVGVELARPTGGFVVRLVEVTASSPGGTQVTYEEATPGPDAVTIQVLVQPHFFAAIPIRPGPVTFRHLTTIRN